MTNNLSREEIEKEANDDLLKSDEQLLSDIHQEILNKDRSVEHNVAHAIKRFSSLLTRSTIAVRQNAEENTKLQKSIEKLTRGLYTLTIMLVIIGLLTLYPIFKGCSDTSNTQLNIPKENKTQKVK